MEISCKKCGSVDHTCDGKSGKKQRYKCSSCRCHFVVGDARVKASPDAKALAVVLYGRGKSSYRFLAKLFKVSPPSIQKWIKSAADSMPEPAVDPCLKEVEFDEMWHFLDKKKETLGMEGGRTH